MVIQPTATKTCQCMYPHPRAHGPICMYCEREIDPTAKADHRQRCKRCDQPVAISKDGLIFCHHCHELGSDPDLPQLDDARLADLSPEAEDIAREHGELMTEIVDALHRWGIAEDKAELAERKLRHQRNSQRGLLHSLSAEARELLADAGCCWIGDTLYLVNIDDAGAIVLRPACPVRA